MFSRYCFQNLNYLCLMITPYNDDYFMKQALVEAQKAFDDDEDFEDDE